MPRPAVEHPLPAQAWAKLVLTSLRVLTDYLVSHWERILFAVNHALVLAKEPALIAHRDMHATNLAVIPLLFVCLPR